MDPVLERHYSLLQWRYSTLDKESNSCSFRSGLMTHYWNSAHVCDQHYLQRSALAVPAATLQWAARSHGVAGGVVVAGALHVRRQAVFCFT